MAAVAGMARPATRQADDDYEDDGEVERSIAEASRLPVATGGRIRRHECCHSLSLIASPRRGSRR